MVPSVENDERSVRDIHFFNLRMHEESRYVMVKFSLVDKTMEIVFNGFEVTS
jgi:hypothetical protein